MKQAMKHANIANDIERHLRANDAMRIIEDSQRAYRDMERLMNPALTLNDVFGPTAMELAAETLNKKMKYIFEDPIKNTLSQIESYAIGKIENFNNIVKDALSYKSLEDVFAPLSEKFAWIDDISKNTLNDLFDNINKTYPANLTEALNLSSTLRDFCTDIPDANMLISAEQTISWYGNSYDISKIKEIIYDGLESAGFFSDTPLTHADIESIKFEIRKIKETPLQKLVWIFISYILLSMFGQHIDTSLVNIKNIVINRDKPSAIKFIENEIPKRIDQKSILENLRFVTTDVLNVRGRNYQKSDLIGKLYFGDVVRIVRKKKNWTLVKFEDKENELEIQGWVFSRYLKKFRF